MMTTTAPRFPITDKMPYEPSALRVPRYMLPSLFGKTEKEEAAARLFTIIHEKGAWTGVAWREIGEQMKAEYDARAEEDKAMQAHYDSLRQFDKAIGWYRVLCVVTLGIYWLLAKKPVVPQQPERKPSPFTTIFMMGPRGVMDGFRSLIADGLIRKETVGEGDTAEDVLYPTVQLAERLAPYTQPN
jgi:hypothetical protein